MTILKEVSEGTGREETEGMAEYSMDGDVRMDLVAGLIGVMLSDW